MRLFAVYDPFCVYQTRIVNCEFCYFLHLLRAASGTLAEVDFARLARQTFPIYAEPLNIPKYSNISQRSLATSSI